MRGAKCGAGGRAAGDIEGRRRICPAGPVVSAGSSGLHAGGQRSGGSAGAVEHTRAVGGTVGAGVGSGEPAGRRGRARSAGDGPGVAPPGLRDLHLRLDGPAQGRAGRAPPGRQAVHVHPAVVRVRRGGRVDTVPFVRLRLLGVGAVRRAVAWRPAGGGAEADGALAAGVLRAAVRGRGDGAEPDAERVPSTDGGAAGGAGGAAPAAPGDPGRGSAGGGCAAPVVRTCRERRDATGEHVRDH